MRRPPALRTAAASLALTAALAAPSAVARETSDSKAAADGEAKVKAEATAADGEAKVTAAATAADGEAKVKAEATAADGEAKVTAAATAADGEAKAKAGARSAQTAPQTRPGAPPSPKRKVWTAADLEALRRKPGSAVLVLETKDPAPVNSGLRREPAVEPQGVVDRYATMVREAERKLAELEKERLAATNPFLRGLASQTGGPRTAEEIAADLSHWKARRDAAQDNLDRARSLTGVEPSAPAAEPDRP